MKVLKSEWNNKPHSDSPIVSEIVDIDPGEYANLLDLAKRNVILDGSEYIFEDDVIVILSGWYCTAYTEIKKPTLKRRVIIEIESLNDVDLSTITVKSRNELLKCKVIEG